MRKLLITISIVLLGLTATAQEENKSNDYQMVMFANVGAKPITLGNLQSQIGVMPNAAFNLGAGAYWNLKGIIFNADFYYSQASSHNNLYETKYDAFTNSFYFGYDLLKKDKLLLTPIVGFVMSSNKVSAYSLNNPVVGTAAPNGTSFLHHDKALRFGVNFEAVVYHKNSIGFTLGYDYSLSGDTEWKIAGSEISSGIVDNFSGFFFNVNIGGHLPLH